MMASIIPASPGAGLRKTVWAAVLAVVLLSAACATAPYTGRRQLMLTSASQENSLGFQSFAEIRKKYPVSTDARLNAMVQRVGERVAAAAERPDFRWEFVVFQDKMANAFCLPGGKVGIFTGIEKYTKDEAGMATVVAHEVAHAILRHSGERLSQSMMAQMGAVGLSVGMAGASPYLAQAVQQAYGLGATVGVLLPYSRTQEYEADRVGLIMMAKAGYDPEAAVGFWQRMMTAQKGKGGPEFLSTHPTDSRRLAEIEKFVPGIKEQYYTPRTSAIPAPAGASGGQGVWRRLK